MVSSIDNWLNVYFGANGSLIGLLTILIGFFSIFNAYISYKSRTALNTRNRTTHLFEELYSVNGYSAIVAPVFNIMLKWHGLAEPAKTDFQNIVMMGWVGYENVTDIKIKLFCDHDESELAHFHYKVRKEAGEITEHEALTAFLYFWSKLDLMLENEVIDKKLTKSLFTRQYDYYRVFIKEIRDLLDEKLEEGDVRPSWYNATLKLEKFFS